MMNIILIEVDLYLLFTIIYALKANKVYTSLDILRKLKKAGNSHSAHCCKALFLVYLYAIFIL